MIIMPLNLLMWGMAALPIVVLLILMVGLQWGATKAAPVGLVIAIFTGLVFYQADLSLIGYEALKGLWSSFVVLIVVWPAILLYEVVTKAKAFVVFRQGLQKITPNELIQVIALGWVFISFLQGITGFGVPVAVGAALLVGIRVKPVAAVVIALIGHAWANTFGTLAVAWDALALQTSLVAGSEMYFQAALWAAIFIWIWNLIAGLSIAYIYGKMEAVKKGLPAILIISLIHGGGQLFLSQINPTLAAFVPASVALIVVFALSRTKRYGEKWKLEDSAIMDREAIENTEEENIPEDMSVHQAFIPYYVLTAITLFVLVIPPIKNFLGQLTLGFSFPETSTGYGFVNGAVDKFSSFAPFTHAGVFLILSSIIGFLFYYSNGWVKKHDANDILKLSFQKTAPSAVAVVGFILMSRMMSGTGQTVILAEGIAETFDVYYAMLSPVVGMLGSFMTSSNMASNILFGEFQLTTASILDLNTATILGSQTAGGTIGNTLSPGNIILGTTTAGIIGKEGIVLKKVLPISLVTALIVGGILFFVTIL
jgi:lactate permease